MAMTTIAAILCGCEGKQGDPGPAGTAGATGAAGAVGPTGATGPDPLARFANGSFSGTITGTRKDGTTPISETFSYTYGPNVEGFYTPVGGAQQLFLNRNLDIFGYNSMEIYLEIKNKGLANQTVSLRNATLAFSKAITGSQVFVLYTNRLLLQDYSIVYPVDPANTAYRFNFTYYFGDDSRAYLNYEYKNIDGRTAYGFATKDGETVYYDIYSGGFVQIVSADGSVSNASATYGSLYFSYDFNYNYMFYKNQTNLSKTATAPSDTYTISNYTYDKNTGNLSFDFTLNYGGYPKPNTTTNPLKVTGKFTGKVYDIVVNSIGNTGGTLLADH